VSAPGALDPSREVVEAVAAMKAFGEWYRGGVATRIAELEAALISMTEKYETEHAYRLEDLEDQQEWQERAEKAEAALAEARQALPDWLEAESNKLYTGALSERHSNAAVRKMELADRYRAEAHRLREGSTP
jgi:hypothetical protein